MEEIQCRYQLIKIKKRLITLYLLNFSDGVFTKALIETGSFVEANPLIRLAIDFKLFYLVKFLLPLILLMVIYKRMVYASKQRLQVAEALIFIAVSIYAVINIVHVLNFIVYFIFPIYSS